MLKHQPARQGGKCNLGIQEGCQHRRGCPHVSANKHQVTKGPKKTNQHKPRPMGQQGRGAPAEHHDRAHHQSAHQAGIKMGRVRILFTAEAARQYLKPGIGTHQNYRKQEGPAEHLPARADHQQHATQARHHQQPAPQGHPVFQDPGCQCGGHQRRQHHHRGELTNRQVLQAKK